MSSRMRQRIETLAELRALAGEEEPVEVRLLLAGGLFSRKRIQYHPSRNGRHWWMFEYISDTEGYYTESQFALTGIPDAIVTHVLFLDEEGVTL